jgi:maleylpyruvate isomerase
MQLYGFWRSTATWRVRIALAYKAIDYELVPVNLATGEQRRDAFIARNPMAHVPVLAFDVAGEPRHLAESMAILEWLEERFPEPALLPRDPFLRARARQLAQIVVSGIQPLQNTKVQHWVRDELHGDDLAWVQHWVARGLESLERLTLETAGRFSVGDELSFADICLVPELSFARRFQIDLATFPTLTAVERACQELPAFERAHADRQPDAARTRVS